MGVKARRHRFTSDSQVFDEALTLSYREHLPNPFFALQKG
jgi:hypothetical protein